MSQENIHIDELPPGAVAYVFNTIDQPGVVAANNFVSIFNPVGSIRTIGASNASNSLGVYRVTAASGGSLTAAANILKFDTASANSIAEVRTGNPTVTLLNSTPAYSAAPPQGAGQINTVPAQSFVPSGLLALCHPGEGIVFQTAAGNTNQMWGIGVAWYEF